MPRNSPHMRILMATYNGAAHLDAQLQSFLDQDYDDWSLMVSDDGSQDGTGDILSAFGAAHPARMAGGTAGVITGPGQGSAANFLSLLAAAVQDAPHAMMAFSDQDDVWLPSKLTRAATWMAANGAETGAALVWICRTTLVDAELNVLGESRVFRRPFGFGNALVQNILAGNTIVLSPAAARGIALSVPAALAAGVPYHDWWIYQMITGMGGQVGSEHAPLVLYRQHGGNHLGHHDPVRGRVVRASMVMRRQFARWLDANLAGLEANAALLTPAHRDMLSAFVAARQTGGRRLARALEPMGIYRQTPRGDRSMRMMAQIGRL